MSLICINQLWRTIAEVNSEASEVLFVFLVNGDFLDWLISDLDRWPFKPFLAQYSRFFTFTVCHFYAGEVPVTTGPTAEGDFIDSQLCFVSLAFKSLDARPLLLASELISTGDCFEDSISVNMNWRLGSQGWRSLCSCDRLDRLSPWFRLRSRVAH